LTVEAAFLAVDLGLEAAALAVAVAFFLVGDFLGMGFFLVMPADLVREPAPEVVAFFFFWGEGAAASLGAEALAFSCGWEDGLVRFVACEGEDVGREVRSRWP
jgi:hypothetical protein